MTPPPRPDAAGTTHGGESRGGNRKAGGGGANGADLNPFPGPRATGKFTMLGTRTQRPPRRRSGTIPSMGDPIRDPDVLERMRTACDLYQAAEDMMRQNLGRRYPDAMEAEALDLDGVVADEADPGRHHHLAAPLALVIEVQLSSLASLELSSVLSRPGTCGRSGLRDLWLQRGCLDHQRSAHCSGTEAMEGGSPPWAALRQVLRTSLQNFQELDLRQPGPRGRPTPPLRRGLRARPAPALGTELAPLSQQA